MLYLASQSPRRRALLARLGLPFAVIDLDVPEVRHGGESPRAYVLRVATDKACAGLARVADDPSAVLVAADTEVVLDDRVFGKPADAADAVAMLGALAGRTHAVLSAVVVASAARTAHVVSCTAVTFAALTQ
ncbi:MAG TPA: Maf family protein, partial [Luteimonas sp.]|nr:Maf family protein [Luteimonas sp.]